MSRRMNLIALLDREGISVLMCRRVKPPYQGLLNLVGGKVEPGETGLEAARRELLEETGYTPDQAPLTLLMELEDVPRDIHLECWGGRLRTDQAPVQELNPLRWVATSEDLADPSRFAGDGNLKQIVERCVLLMGGKPETQNNDVSQG